MIGRIIMLYKCISCGEWTKFNAYCYECACNFCPQKKAVGKDVCTQRLEKGTCDNTCDYFVPKHRRCAHCDREREGDTDICRTRRVNGTC